MTVHLRFLHPQSSDVVAEKFGLTHHIFEGIGEERTQVGLLVELIMVLHVV